MLSTCAGGIWWRVGCWEAADLTAKGCWQSPHNPRGLVHYFRTLGSSAIRGKGEGFRRPRGGNELIFLQELTVCDKKCSNGTKSSQIMTGLEDNIGAFLWKLEGEFRFWSKSFFVFSLSRITLKVLRGPWMGRNGGGGCTLDRRTVCAARAARNNQNQMMKTSGR